MLIRFNIIKGFGKFLNPSRTPCNLNFMNIPILKRLVILFLVIVSLGLTACNQVVPTAGLKPYVDVADNYQFLYPNGWLEVKVSGEPDVVIRDLINPTENASVIISDVAEDQTLESLGSPGEVGYLLQQNAIAPANSGITAELVDASAQEQGDKTYYWFEYEVVLPDQKRHDLASVVVDRGRLYTFNVSTPEARWRKVKTMFETILASFSVTS
jgi:photosystem II oxygen-evolving enhancer protein 2